MSAVPIPKPRAFAQQENKKPVPLPRKIVQKNEPVEEQQQSDFQNTFSRRMRTISSTSKQISEEISGKVQETKKAVIESTRQSVRKITRRFSSPQDQSDAASTETVDHSKNVDESLNSSSDIFNTIRFQSPLTVEPETKNDNVEPIYSNYIGNDSDSDESVSLPPPSHPPPPLPDESMYDRPQSIAGTISRPPVAPRTQYEAVFPVCPVLPSGSDSESGTDSKTGTLDTNAKLQRSGSWSFYDPVTLNEVTYANTESTGFVQANKSDNRSSGESSAYSELNLCYENYILELRKKYETDNKAAAPPTPPRPSKSTILEFDPLVKKPGSVPHTNNNDLVLLEQLLESDLYGNITGVDPNYDQWSITSELEGDEYINPPTPPKRFDSLGEEARTQPVVDDKSKTNWFTSDKPTPVVESKKSGWMKQLNDVLKKVPESARNIRGLYKDKCLDRPILNYRAISNHKGMLFKISRKSVEDLFGEYNFRWCVLASGILTFYTDNTCENVKEHYSLESILSVQALEKKLK